MSLAALLSSATHGFTPVIDSSLPNQDYLPIDLSLRNSDLDISVLQDPYKHHSHIQAYLKEHDAKVAYGGYLEQRKLYDRSDYFANDIKSERRNIHLGIDLWCEAETKVLCPLDGQVHSFQNNTNFGDYGPTIILQHQLEDQLCYTLYGHLSLASLQGLAVGQAISAGQAFASLGSPEVNGNYAPHLHFQIIQNMQGNFGDYPGVASASEVSFYKTNCPDPNILLKIY